MKNQLKNAATSAATFAKRNKLPLISAFLAVAVVGVPVYAHNAKNVEPPVKQEVMAVKTEALKPEPKVEKKKSTAKKAETTTTKTTYTEPAKTEPTYEEKKKTYSEPTYKTVSVSIAKGGAGVVGTIGTEKAGKCDFLFKNYTDPDNPQYKYVTVSASGGTCTTAIPDGTWTHAMVSYKSNDYLAKGYSSKIEL